MHIKLRSLRAASARVWQLRLYRQLLNSSIKQDDILPTVAQGLLSLGVRQAPADTAAARAKVEQLLARPRAMATPLALPFIKELASIFGLSRDQLRVVWFVCILHDHRPLIDAVEAGAKRWPGTRGGLLRLLGDTLELPPARLRETIRPRGALLSSGLLYASFVHCSDASECLEPADHTSQLFEDGVLDERFLGRLFERAEPGTLKLADYGHLQAAVQRIADLLRAARRDGSGANVLLHGPPGTGKSELTRALASTLGMELYLVRSADSDGEPIDALARLRAFETAQRALAHNPRALLLFDEIEDVFRHGNGADSPKVNYKSWVNRRLESMTLPCVWIGNRIDGLDDSQLRRFDIVLEVVPPPRSARRALLERALDATPVPASLLECIAGREAFAPAHFTRVARLMRRLAPAPEARAGILRDSLNALLRIAGEPPLQEDGPQTTFDPELVRSTPPLAPMLSLLERRPQARICLYGPPGTGKTALAAYLAQRLDMPLHRKRASDLLGSWVGQTEARIAAMFEQATRDGALLCLDEADSFLRDRQSARAAWEVTQVNELLTWLEDFEGVFVASTNLMGALDAAALRRFDFKLRFDYLDPRQRLQLFERHVAQHRLHPDLDEADRMRRLQRLDRLTPGDFTAVRRRLEAADGQAGQSDLLAWLDEEQALKPGNSRPIGFAH